MKPEPITIDMSELFLRVNEWMSMFAPTIAIGAGISIALSITQFLLKVVAEADTKRLADSWKGMTDVANTWIEGRKRKAHDHLYLERDAEELGTVWAETGDGEIVQVQRKD